MFGLKNNTILKIERCPICKGEVHLSQIEHPETSLVKYWQVICPQDKYNIVKNSKIKAVKEWNKQRSIKDGTY